MKKDCWHPEDVPLWRKVWLLIRYAIKNRCRKEV